MGDAPVRAAEGEARGSGADTPMDARELARRLGRTPRWLYRRDNRDAPANLDKLYGLGMPRPVNPLGRPTWERAGMLAWLARYHPFKPRRAANDDFEAPAIAEDRAALARRYGAAHG